jgi:hypothetical protein
MGENQEVVLDQFSTFRLAVLFQSNVVLGMHTVTSRVKICTGCVLLAEVCQCSLTSSLAKCP